MFGDIENFWKQSEISWKKVEFFSKIWWTSEKISLFWRLWSIFHKISFEKYQSTFRNSPKWPLTPLIQNEKYQSTFRYFPFYPPTPLVLLGMCSTPKSTDPPDKHTHFSLNMGFNVYLIVGSGWSRLQFFRIWRWLVAGYWCSKAREWWGEKVEIRTMVGEGRSDKDIEWVSYVQAR